LHPASEDRFARADDQSLVLRGTFHGIRLLLLSDLGRPGQNALLEREPDLRADILVTGLPADGEALSDVLLDVVQPQVIVVADSEFPAGERASPKLRERLAARKIPVLYTRTAGAARVDLAPRGWEIRGMTGARLRSATPRREDPP
jgi:beta-lactamase superfamily II metal-dependent hydrolase